MLKERQGEAKPHQLWGPVLNVSIHSTAFSFIHILFTWWSFSMGLVKWGTLRTTQCIYSTTATVSIWNSKCSSEWRDVEMDWKEVGGQALKAPIGTFWGLSVTKGHLSRSVYEYVVLLPSSASWFASLHSLENVSAIRAIHRLLF